MSLSWSAPRALLFDLDGTLVHSLPDVADAIDAMLASYRLPVLGEAQIGTMIGNGALKLVERALRLARENSAPAHSPALLTEALLADAHQRFLQHYRQHYCVRSTLCPGVAAVLPALQASGITLAVVTNKPLEFVAPLLTALGIVGHFPLLIGGDSLAAKKPSPLPLLHACQRLGIAVADTIMVGDSRNDIDAARTAGMRNVAVSYGYNHGEPLTAVRPDVIIDQLDHLPTLWS